MGSTELITALVCTRNRGDSVLCTTRSILASTHANYEIIVVDQSTDDSTEDALAPFIGDPRVRYVRSDTQGLGRARNLGLQLARSEIVACTDDDCEVPAKWLSVIHDAFLQHPKVAVLFCNVDPAPYDPAQGFIPAYQRKESQLLTKISEKCTARGIGAGLAVRRKSIQELGGFDGMLGAGAKFPSCEDGDIAVRALLHGFQVYETCETSVLHYGYRSHSEGRRMTQRDWTAIGAAYAKPLRCGHWRFWVVPAYEFVVMALWPPIYNLLRLRKPSGLSRISAFIRGFCEGWATPVNRDTLLFRNAQS